jgi:hypothetical protein
MALRRRTKRARRRRSPRSRDERSAALGVARGRAEGIELLHGRQQRLAMLLAEGRTDATDLDQLWHALRAPAQHHLEHGIGLHGEGRLALAALQPPRSQALERPLIDRIVGTLGLSERLVRRNTDEWSSSIATVSSASLETTPSPRKQSCLVNGRVRARPG